MPSPGESRRLPSARVMRWSPWLLAGLAVTLVTLIAHAYAYRFVCDDAYISFRYARNLAQGHGLVFNPGFERVEGYSNFLLVVLLAGLDRLSVRPESGAVAISLLATVALWAMVASWALRRPPASGLGWLVLAPLAMLAATRSIAVWSTSGLETRLFECLAIGAMLRLVAELEASRDGARPRALAGTLFALAALTRPDGLLLAAVAFGTEAVERARRREALPGTLLRGWIPFAVLIGAHFAFRLAYYGAWLPNTYYAKVGGRFWWDAGTRYLAAFALEYAAWIWLPLSIAGVWTMARARDSAAALVLTLPIVAHALYVASIGGDHFEYRPLDLYLPLLFLLAYEGLKVIAARGRGALAGLVLLLALVGLFELPWQSHVQAPSRYMPGFPGRPVRDPERITFLDPSRDPIYRLPGLRSIASAHRELLTWLSLRFVGLRQEEHALFVREAAEEGRALSRLAAERRIPADLYIATAAVGAIPYLSNLRTLDRLGLTDARVARQASTGPRIMAHDRAAPYEEAAGRGVDLWAAHDVHLYWIVGARHPLELVSQGRDFWAAEVDSSHYLVAWLPQGIERTRERTPRLEWVKGSREEFLIPYVNRSARVVEQSATRHPEDFAARRDAGYFLFIRGSAAEALPHFEAALRMIGDDPEIRLYLGRCRADLGDVEGARADLTRALELATQQQDVRLARAIEAAMGPRSP